MRDSLFGKDMYAKQNLDLGVRLPIGKVRW